MSSVKNVIERLIIIDTSVIDYGGHYYSYDLSVINSAKKLGIRCVLGTNKRFNVCNDTDLQIEPFFTHTFWDIYSTCENLKSYGRTFDQEEKRNLVGSIIRTRRIQQYEREMGDFFELIQLQDNDMVFFPTICHLEVNSICKIVKMKGLNYQSLNFLFRRPLFMGSDWEREDNGFVRELKEVFSRIRECHFRRIIFYSDTEMLAKQYSQVTQMDFGVLPIPHSKNYCDKNRLSSCVRIGYLGGARTEKGFNYLPSIIKRMDSSKFSFVIQCNMDEKSKEISRTYKEINKLSKQQENIRILKKMNMNEYDLVMENLDVILLLYDPLSYAYRSSGIFVEAVTSGTMVITTNGTWIANEIERMKEKDIICGYTVSSSNEVSKCLLLYLNNLNLLQDDIKKASIDYGMYHNSDYLLEYLYERSKI